MSLLHPNLLAFMAIVERGTVVLAAKKIGITQTGVTQRIRALESELGQTLFIRSRKGMQLTHDGKMLLKYCQTSIEAEGQIRTDKESEIVNLKISGPSSIMRSRVIPNSIKVLKKYSQLRIQFDLMDLQPTDYKLKTGESQLVLMRSLFVTNEMDSKILKPERYILIGPKDFKNRDIKEILKNETIIDFDENDTYTFEFLKQHNLFKYSNQKRIFVNNVDALGSMIELGAGFSVFAEEMAKELITSKKVINLMPGKFLDLKDICVAWYPRKYMPSYLNELIKAF